MNIEELQIQAEKTLDVYEKFSGIPEFVMYDTDQVSKYFSMNITQLNKLSTIECAEAAYILAQYSFYFQRMYNRESAKHRWAQDQLSKLVCDKMKDYDKYAKYDHKISLIAKENNVVNRLQSVISYTSQMMERMNFLSTSIKTMCEAMSNLQKTKSYSNRVIEHE